MAMRLSFMLLATLLLAVGLAQPTPGAAARATASEPVRLVIPAIKLDRKLLSVGLNKQRIPIVPKHDIGWYNLSAAPGQGENIVLWGHVLPFLHAPHLPAPFARMKELAPGAAITLVDAAGRAHAYVVTQQIRAAPEDVGYVLNQGRELLTMVSCIGEGIYAGGAVVDYTERLITIAEPAGP